MLTRSHPLVTCVLLIVIGLMLAACGAPQPTPLPPAPTAEPTQVPTATAAPTNTPAPTSTLAPTSIPAPTNTPAPTATPAPTQNIYEILQSDSQYSTLVSLIDQARLKALLVPGPVTLFAPTNDAFAALSQDQLAQIQSDPQLLNNVLSYHIVPGRYMAKDLRATQALTTSLPGMTLTIHADAKSVRVNDSLVITADQQTTSGIIDTIGSVLMLQPAATAQVVSTDTSTVTGTVSYLPRIALVPTATLEVQLLDVTQTDRPAQVITSQVITANGQQVPISYTLTYLIDAIIPSHTYAVAARITTDGQVAWISTQPYYALTKGKLTGLDIVVEQVKGGTVPTTAYTPLIETITGTVTMTQPIALPPGAVIEVDLADVSSGAATAQIVASQTITSAGQPAPIPFAIAYDPAQIVLDHTYALQAKVYVNGQLKWTNPQMYPVLTNNQPWMNVEVAIEPIVAPVSTGPITNTITGVISFTSPITFGANAAIKVQLLDVSRADAAANVVGEQSIDASDQAAPLPFTLQFDPAQIDPSHFYMLLVTINVDGELRWVNHQAVYVLTHGSPASNVEVDVQLVE
jgi:uncharacterized lipoprotein YbaY